jgi:hypothetical protein
METTPPEPINFIVDTLLSQGLHPELSQEINQLSTETISPKILSKRLMQIKLSYFNGNLFSKQTKQR